MYKYALMTSMLLAVHLSPALAHVVLETRSAAAGSYYKGVFQVGHGCDGSATVSVSVEIPDGVLGVKPMPKPGWTLETTSAKLAKPYESHGKTITEGVKSVTWKGGPLADAHYDEFVLRMRVPEAPGKLWFKVIQQCQQGRWEWVDIPAPGKTRRDVKAPAADLEILPAPAKPAPPAHTH